MGFERRELMAADTSDAGLKRRARDQSMRNAAGGIAFIASVAVGIAIQGLVKGDAARVLGLPLLVLAVLVCIKSANVANNLAREPDLTVRHHRKWLNASIGDTDRLGPLTCAAAVAVIVMAGFGIQLNSRPDINYRSAYDGVDPVHAQCASDSRGDGTVVASRLVHAGSTLIGTLNLEYSKFCGSHWAKLTLTPTGLRAVRSTPVVISTHRPADDTVAPYSLVVQDVPYLWGNMVGGGVCAYAEVQDSGSPGRTPAFQAQTTCRNT